MIPTALKGAALTGFAESANNSQRKLGKDLGPSIKQGWHLGSTNAQEQLVVFSIIECLRGSAAGA